MYGRSTFLLLLLLLTTGSFRKVHKKKSSNIHHEYDYNHQPSSPSRNLYPKRDGTWDSNLPHSWLDEPNHPFTEKNPSPWSPNNPTPKWATHNKSPGSWLENVQHTTSMPHPTNPGLWSGHSKHQTPSWMEQYPVPSVQPPSKKEKHKKGHIWDVVGDSDIGSTTNLLNLRGTIREYFAVAAALTDTGTSVVCSPISAIMPLGMLIFGSHGKTKRDLEQAIGLSGKSEAHSYFQNLKREMQSTGGAQVQQCSKVFVHNTKRVRSDYCSRVQSTFGTCIGVFDVHDKVKSAQIVNEWVDKHTKHQVREVVVPADISIYTRVMVVDALTFEAKWKHKFGGSRTQTFYGPKRSTVYMMSNDEEYMYGFSSVLGAQAILIPYSGGKASMLVLLPYQKNGLELLLRQLKLAPDLINKIKMKKTFVKLRFPQFTIQSDLDLKVLYEKVGLREIHTDGAGMDEIIEDEVIKVDKGVHRVFIDVNEQGTRGVVGSFAQVVGYTASHTQDISFNADHPFLFFVISNKEQILAGTFVG